MERGASKFCSEWIFADTGNNGFVWLGGITDVDDMGVFIKSTTCPKCLIKLVIKLNT